MGSTDTHNVCDAVRRVLDGDVDSYRVIYNLTDRPLRSIIRSKSGRLSDDFVREVAILTHERALRHLADYDPARASYVTWLGWQAVSIASWLRGKWYDSRNVVYDETVHGPWAVTTTGPADDYERQRQSGVLREELNRLSKDRRDVIELNVMGGRTQAETARLLGIPLIRVRRLREDALRTLGRRLKRRGFRPFETDSTPAPAWRGVVIASNEKEWGVPVTTPKPNEPVATDAAGTGKEGTGN